MSSLKALDDEKKQFIKTYTARELFDLVFTDYKNAPSELAKIPNIQTLARERMSQITDAGGISAKVVEDFFNIVQDVIEISVDTGLPVEEVVVAPTAPTSDVGVSYVDYGGGG